MKTIKILIIALTVALSSCSKDNIDDDCNCNKYTYETQSSVVIGTNGLPQTVYNTVLISNEVVVCQEEGRTDLPNNMYYVIDCEQI